MLNLNTKKLKKYQKRIFVALNSKTEKPESELVDIYDGKFEDVWSYDELKDQVQSVTDFEKAYELLPASMHSSTLFFGKPALNFPFPNTLGRCIATKNFKNAYIKIEYKEVSFTLRDLVKECPHDLALDYLANYYKNKIKANNK